MAIATLGGVPQAYRVARGSLTVKENTRGKPNTASFGLIQVDGMAPPSHSQTVTITDDTATYTLFSGEIMATDQMIVGPGNYQWTCSATDWELLLHRHFVAQRYVNQALGSIIRQVCASGAPEIDTSLVPDGPVVPSYTANYKLPAEIIQELCEWHGYTYWVDYDRKLNVVSTLGNTAALQITPANSRGLTVTVDRSQLRNKVIVKGGFKASAPVTQTWTGDGVEGDFPLQYKPYSPNPTAWIQEVWSGTTFDTSRWLEYDVTNPSPPPGHLGSDGYIFPFPASQANKYTSLQVVGGPGSYGTVGLVSVLLYPRADQRQFRQTAIFTVASDITMGLSDGSGAGLASIKHGIRFKTNGTISRMESGTEQTSANAYVANGLTDYQVKIVLKAAGADYYIQGGAYGTIYTKDWTLLWSTGADTTANLAVVPVLVSSGEAALFYTFFHDQAFSAKLTVGGTDKTVGYDNVDNSSGVDAMLNADNMQLRFFGSSPGPSTIPALGAAIVLTYTFAQPIFSVRPDPVSIERIKALEGGTSDGIQEGLVVDTSIVDQDAADARALAELQQFANPEVSVSWMMPVGTFTLANRPRGGQVIEVQSGAASGLYLIQDLTLRHVGDDNYAMESVSAGSRLRGLEDWIQSLVAKGRRFPQDPNAVIDTIISPNETLRLSDDLELGRVDIAAADTLTMSDQLTLGAGTMPPWKWGPDANPMIWDSFEWQ